MSNKKRVFGGVLAVIICVTAAVCFLTNNTGKALTYYITTDLSNGQQTEVHRAYNRKNRMLPVTVCFEATEGVEEIELVYGQKQNGTDTAWSYCEPVMLALGKAETFTVPADHHFSFAATPRDGVEGKVKLVFTEEPGKETYGVMLLAE